MITKSEISRYRQAMNKIIKKIGWLSSRCLFPDPLIKGSPAIVYKKCGRKGCKCMTDPDKRHGPYKTIQVIRDGKSRQISLRRDQEEFWLLAKNHQYQYKILMDLKSSYQELHSLAVEVIKKREMEFPNDG